MLQVREPSAVLDTGGAWPCVVFDAVLEAPDALVELACQHRAAFAVHPGTAYPGLELPLPPAVAQRIADAFEPMFADRLGVGARLDVHGRLAMVTVEPGALAPIQRVCHRDRLAVPAGERALAAVLYLFHETALGGTSFFSPRRDAAQTEALMAYLAQCSAAEADALLGAERGYLTQSNAQFELRRCIEPRWNRLIVYDGCQFHCSHIERGVRLSDDPRHGRLTLNLFMRYQDAHRNAS